ncbi:hypothetical protein [Neoroseomonas soli]|uniref:Uncharacterized protein n=1 Tax=Neoroseomonas soli TaxID=1081025 RepID=A0A9X9X0H7_9PROT|nr:hypothetical protein [Neoroseomonas soli]MBR0672906.1 hypothetical protein [Neoroseomonas soli]
MNQPRLLIVDRPQGSRVYRNRHGALLGIATPRPDGRWDTATAADRALFTYRNIEDFEAHILRLASRPARVPTGLMIELMAEAR